PPMGKVGTPPTGSTSRVASQVGGSPSTSPRMVGRGRRPGGGRGGAPQGPAGSTSSRSGVAVAPGASDRRARARRSPCPPPPRAAGGPRRPPRPGARGRPAAAGVPPPARGPGAGGGGEVARGGRGVGLVGGVDPHHQGGEGGTRHRAGARPPSRPQRRQEE